LDLYEAKGKGRKIDLHRKERVKMNRRSSILDAAVSNRELSY